MANQTTDGKIQSRLRGAVSNLQELYEDGRELTLDLDYSLREATLWFRDLGYRVLNVMEVNNFPSARWWEEQSGKGNNIVLAPLENERHLEASDLDVSYSIAVKGNPKARNRQESATPYSNHLIDLRAIRELDYLAKHTVRTKLKKWALRASNEPAESNNQILASNILSRVGTRVKKHGARTRFLHDIYHCQIPGYNAEDIVRLFKTYGQSMQGDVIEISTQEKQKHKMLAHVSTLGETPEEMWRHYAGEVQKRLHDTSSITAYFTMISGPEWIIRTVAEAPSAVQFQEKYARTKANLIQEGVSEFEWTQFIHALYYPVS